MAVPYQFVDDPHSIGVRLNIGMRGSGKSTLLDYQLSQILRLKKRACNRIIAVHPPREKFHFQDFGHLVTTPTEFFNVFGHCPPERFHVRFVTTDPAYFDFVCACAMRLKDLFLVVDEVWHFSRTKAGAHMDLPHFNELVAEGRHELVRFIGACQRPTQIHNNLMNLTDELNVFRTKDLHLLREWLDSKENLQRARYLDKFQFFCCPADRPPELVVVPGYEKAQGHHRALPLHRSGA